MKINFRSQFYGEFGIILVIIVLTNNTALPGEIQARLKTCKAVNEKKCVILCHNWNLDSRSGAVGLGEILHVEGKKFKNCTLILENCEQSNKTTYPWKEIDSHVYSKIENLKILNSLIDFNQLKLKIFKSLRRLMLKNTTTVSLQTEVFYQLPKLQKLQIKRNNVFQWVEKGFLQKLTLNSIQIQGINLNQTATAQFFKNLTDQQDVSSVHEVDWSYNNFGNFTKDLLVHFPNLNELILTNSNIINFENGTFSNGNIRRVYLNKNQIRKLPEKIFRPLLESALYVSLNKNNLLCDCEMKWLQNFLKKHKHQNFDIKCGAPEGAKFLEADMCPKKSNNSKNVFATHCTSTKSSEVANNYILWPNSIKFLPILNKPSKKFTVTNDESEFIEITFDNTINMEKAFLLYGNYVNATSPQFNCLKIQQQKLSIYAIPNVNYLICLATIHKYFKINIFECLPLKTKPLYENQLWLTKKSIPQFIISILILFLFALTMGALILYLSVRKNPSLIRGSKRVIEVKKHDKAQILIMPRDYESLNQTDDFPLSLMNPQLPLESSRSCDTISTVSYVSAHQPTQLEILTYRLNRLRELFNNNIPSSVSSVPMSIATPINQRLPPNVDLLIEYEWYTITTTTTTTTTTTNNNNNNNNDNDDSNNFNKTQVFN